MELIKFNHTTKEERTQVVREIFQEVLEGRINPMELHIRMKCLEEVVKQLTSMPAYKAIVLDDAEKHGKSFQYHNAKVDIREVGVKYDYSECGSSELSELYVHAANIDSRIKVLESYLKNIPALCSIEVVNPSTGEVETHYPPAKTSTTSVAVTLK
jgi:hypothetical protein